MHNEIINRGRVCLSVLKSDVLFIFFSIVMYISGAKFGGQLPNASWDILDSVLYCFSGTIYDVITFLICITQKRNISKTKEDFPKWKRPFLILKRL